MLRTLPRRFPALVASILVASCAPAVPAGPSVIAAPPPQNPMRTVEYGMLNTPGAVIASDTGAFVFRSGEQFQTPYSARECPRQPTPDSYQQALALGAQAVWIGMPSVPQPLYGLLLFCDVPTAAQGPAARSHLVRIPDQYVAATEGGRLSVVYEPVSATVQQQVPSQGACTNTCAYANDGECDDGGPGSLYAVCQLGTDCNDCGARGAGTQTQATTEQYAGWILYLSRMPFPGVAVQSTPPTAVAEVVGTGPAVASGGGVPMRAPATSGQGGIGTQVRFQGEELIVVSVLPGGGAAAAGLTQGDAILAVDGAAVGTLGGLEGAVARLQGTPGTQVSLRVRRLVSGAEEQLVVTRQALR